ncbi:hypothetical protein [Streptomyces lydicus]|uniref:NADH-quinone oxidoreductase subunit B family protein n=1 Tax=Streptomyces lydicus TaxID=47763 RepID=UPI003324E505
MNPASERRPQLAVWKFASCDGCQLTLLDCEDELLGIAEWVEITHFLEASSRPGPGPYDLSLVEGSVTTAQDAERIQQIRAASRRLVTIGACATAGGVQALRNYADVAEFQAVVYARPDYLDTLATSTPISAHVPVDFELRGCPIDRGQLVAEAALVPPTAQNQAAIEQDLRRTVQERLDAGPAPTDDELTALCERVIRNHDPCISCSTHFLDLTVARE